MIVYRKKHTNTNCNATFYIFYLKVSYVKIFYKVLFRFVQKKLFIKKLGSDKHTNLYENVNRSKYAFMAFKYNELWKLPANMVVVSKEEVEKNLPEKPRVFFGLYIFYDWYYRTVVAVAAVGTGIWFWTSLLSSPSRLANSYDTRSPTVLPLSIIIFMYSAQPPNWPHT